MNEQHNCLCHAATLSLGEGGQSCFFLGRAACMDNLGSVLHWFRFSDIVQHMVHTISKSYKFRVDPTETQRAQLERDFFAARWVYNRSLDLISRAYAERKERLSWVAVSRMLTEARKLPQFGFLRDASSDVQTQALRNLDKAFAGFFRNVKTGRKPGYPKPKNRYSKQSVRYVFDQRSAGKVVDWNAGRLSLPKLGVIKVRWSQYVPAMPKMVTVSRDAAGRYFVSMAIEEPARLLPVTSGAVGVDVGIKTLAMLSDGTSFANPKHGEALAKRLRRYQRCFARRVKGSNRREVMRRKIARLHCRIADSRANTLHQASIRIVRNNQIIVTESLNVRGMMANRNIARAVGDASFSELLRQIKYKSGWYSRTHLEISQWFPSSKTCSGCGYVLDELRLDVRQWTCPKCGAEQLRDLNAAKNILAEGLKDLLPASRGKVTRREPAVVNAGGELRTESCHEIRRRERRIL